VKKIQARRLLPGRQVLEIIDMNEGRPVTPHPAYAVEDQPHGERFFFEALNFSFPQRFPPPIGSFFTCMLPDELFQEHHLAIYRITDFFQVFPVFLPPGCAHELPEKPPFTALQVVPDNVTQ